MDIGQTSNEADIEFQTSKHVNLASRLDPPLEDPGVPIKRYINTYANSETPKSEPNEIDESQREMYEDAPKGPIPEAYDMQLDMPPTPAEPIRNDAIYLYGTDNMSTEEILKYASSLGPPPAHLEWIDDSSCVLVYNEDKDAMESIVALSVARIEESQVDDEWKRRVSRAKTILSHPNALLSIRFATSADVKKKHARTQSRWYEQRSTRRNNAPHKRSPYERPSRRDGSTSSSHRGKELFPDGKAIHLSSKDVISRPPGGLYMDLVDNLPKKRISRPSASTSGEDNPHGRKPVSYTDALADRIEKGSLAGRISSPSLKDRVQ